MLHRLLVIFGPLEYLHAARALLDITWAKASPPFPVLANGLVRSMGLLGKSQFLAFLVHSLQAPSIRTGPTQDLWTPARLDCFLENCHRAPSELLARGGGLHHHDPAMEAKNGVLCFASTSSRTQPAEELHKRGPSPLIRVATAAEFSTERLLRIRRRNIRFLCASRRNRKRGLLPPAKAAAAEAAEKWNAGEEAFLRRSLELKDPLVNEAPVRRWRTQWCVRVTYYSCIYLLAFFPSALKKRPYIFFSFSLGTTCLPISGSPPLQGRHLSH